MIRILLIALCLSSVPASAQVIRGTQQGSIEDDALLFEREVAARKQIAEYQKYLSKAEKRNGHLEVIAQPQFFLLPKTIQTFMLKDRAEQGAVRIVFALNEKQREQAGTFKDVPGGLKITPAKAAKAVKRLSDAEIATFKAGLKKFN